MTQQTPGLLMPADLLGEEVKGRNALSPFHTGWLWWQPALAEHSRCSQGEAWHVPWHSIVAGTSLGSAIPPLPSLAGVPRSTSSRRPGSRLCPQMLPRHIPSPTRSSLAVHGVGPRGEKVYCQSAQFPQCLLPALPLGHLNMPAPAPLCLPLGAMTGLGLL